MSMFNTQQMELFVLPQNATSAAQWQEIGYFPPLGDSFGTATGMDRARQSIWELAATGGSDNGTPIPTIYINYFAFVP